MAGIDIGERARKLYKEALVWDDHSGFDPDGNPDLANLQRWAKSGVHYLSVNVGYDVIDWRSTLRNLASFRAWLQQHPDQYELLLNDVDKYLPNAIEEVLRYASPTTNFRKT